MGKSVTVNEGSTESLAKLMMESNLGVSPLAVYEVKRVDSDYFPEV